MKAAAASNRSSDKRRRRRQPRGTCQIEWNARSACTAAVYWGTVLEKEREKDRRSPAASWKLKPASRMFSTCRQKVIIFGRRTHGYDPHPGSERVSISLGEIDSSSLGASEILGSFKVPSGFIGSFTTKNIRDSTLRQRNDEKSSFPGKKSLMFRW